MACCYGGLVHCIDDWTLLLGRTYAAMLMASCVCTSGLDAAMEFALADDGIWVLRHCDMRNMSRFLLI
jgi:hypothetical protein